MNAPQRLLLVILLLLVDPGAAEASPTAGAGARGLAGWDALSTGGARLRSRGEWRMGDWLLRLDARRTTGETGLLPHGAWWLGRRTDRWTLAAGHLVVATPDRAALGRGRTGDPGRLGALVEHAPAGCGSSTAPERGLALERRTGSWNLGVLAASTSRDLRSDGQGFVVDMPHQDDTRDRQGAWQDQLGLAWAAWEGPAWRLQGLAGLRGAPSGGGGLAAGLLAWRWPQGQLALLGERGESRSLHAQMAGMEKAVAWQVDLWRGRRDGTRFSQPVLPLGDGREAGGQALRLRHRLAAGRLSLDMRRLDPAARTTDRSGLSWSVEWEGPGPADTALSLRRRASEDRPAGGGRDDWRLGLRPRRRRELDWELAFERLRSEGPATRLWNLRLEHEGRRGRRLRWGGRLQLVWASGGESRLRTFAPAPGLARVASLGDGRQAWSLGCWLSSGGHRLSAGCLWREDPAEAAAPRPLPQVQWSWGG